MPVDLSKRYIRIRLAPPGEFAKGSFRTKRLANGRLLIIGCPKGRWNAKTRRCRVGTRAQALRIPRR